jgi:FHA domain
MDLLVKVRRLESRIARTLESAAERVSGSGVRSPLEVIHDVLDALEQAVVAAGRGRRVFPYNTITVLLAAASPEARSRYEAVVDDRPTLRERILDRLRSTGAEVDDVDVKVAFAPQARADWKAAHFHVEFARVTAPLETVTVAQPARDPLEITILNGTALEPTYTLNLAHIDLGRGIDVRDTRNHLLRTNHVAFTEGDGDINKSVSRRHAHITCDPASGDYRIFDDGSAHGTSVLRNGSAIVVRSGSRGVRLRDGDEIALGEARVRVSRPSGRSKVRG